MTRRIDAARVRVAILDDYQHVARAIVDWEGALPGAHLAFFHQPLRGQELVAALAGFDVVVTMRERTVLSRPILGALPDLKLLVVTGMGNNTAIDFSAAADLGVTVCGTGALHWGAVELTWGLILAVERHIPEEDRLVHEGGWQSTLGTSLHGGTLGLVGLGKLGSKVGEVGRAFGMRVVAWSPHLTAERASRGGAELVTKQELFAASDVVSLHLVLGDTTRGVVGETELRAMKPTAILVNTSRGPIVEEGALVRALREGWIAGAGIDVYDTEPLAAGHPLRSAPRSVLTPHLGYVTADNYRVYYGEALADIQAFVGGAPVREVRPAIRV